NDKDVPLQADKINTFTVEDNSTPAPNDNLPLDDTPLSNETLPHNNNLFPNDTLSSENNSRHNDNLHLSDNSFDDQNQSQIPQSQIIKVGANKIKKTKNKSENSSKNSKKNNLAETINCALGHRQPELTEQLAEIENSEPTQLHGKTLPDPIAPVCQQTIRPRLRYFTRGAKRKSASEDILEEEHFAERIKAYIVQLQTLDDTDNLIDHAFAAQVICGVQIPLTYHQAIQDTKWGKFWRQAIDAELIALLQNSTWKEVVRPQGVNLVFTKWVFTVKPKLDRSIDRFKARLVARGFSQKAGEEYHETFAPTVRIDTLRLILAMAASENLECSQFDIKNAFTESIMKEEIYATTSLGVEVRPGNVLQLLRSFYGLKQAARDWNLLMKTELLRWGFDQSLADPCMFTHKIKPMILLVYVDVIVAVAKSQDNITWFYSQLSARFNAKNLGEIHKVLGIRVTRDRKSRTIYLDQTEYIRSVLKKIGMMGSEKYHKVNTPVVGYNSLGPSIDNDKRIDFKEYQQAIGSLMFAMIMTRPDIAFVMGKLSQHMSDPAEHHGHALKHLMRYLRSTADQKIRYGPGGDEVRFRQYTDADWESDISDRKSVSGSVTMFYEGPISWSSKKQRSVATSSCESEYM
ncbi:hypothetical protein K3495_g13329, partial [Podosphaera aphanis]